MPAGAAAGGKTASPKALAKGKTGAPARRCPTRGDIGRRTSRWGIVPCPLAGVAGERRGRRGAATPLGYGSIRASRTA